MTDVQKLNSGNPADAARLEHAKKIIKSVCVADPMTGRHIPVYEPDPTKPGSYRETAAAKRIRLGIDAEPVGEMTTEPVGQLTVDQSGRRIWRPGR